MRPIDADELKRLIKSGDDLVFSDVEQEAICEMIDNQETVSLPDKFKESDFEELKPCPFCGSDNIKVNMPYADTYQVLCYNCGCTNGFYWSSEKAVEAWNTRKAVNEEEEV